MPLKYWLKFSLLTFAFTATIASLFILKQDHMSQFWTSLGLSPQGTVLNWCDERVRSVYFYKNKAKITEEAGKWLWKSNDIVMLDYLGVEKWFAKYCHLPIQDSTTQKSQGKALFEIEFITGQRLTFHEIDQDHIKLRGQVYKSPALRKALKELLAFDPKMK